MQRWILAAAACLLLSACSQTNTGEGSSLVTGAAGPDGSQSNKAAQLPRCEKPFGTLALVEKQMPALAQMGLTSPVPLLRLMVAQSNCFQVVDRGQALARIEQEKHVSGKGGLGKLAEADYFLTPDVVFQNANAGRMAGGAGALLPGVAGVLAGGITTQSSEAQTALYLTHTKSGLQVAAATGAAKSHDFGFGGGAAGIGGGYANTEIGKTVAASFLDAYSNLVNQVRAAPQIASRR